MLRSCSKCGRIHDINFKCNGGGRLPKTNEQALRRRTSWTNKSRDIRERSKYLCAVCLDQGNARADDDIEVHHIRKLRDYPEGLLEDENLIALCTFHHKQADNNELDTDYLRELAKKRDLVDFPLL
jgi:5-methylcytosine-specific restriction endonuclease McrA